MDLIITILPVVTKDLPISPRFTPYIFLSRWKFSTLTTRQPMVEFYLLTFPRFPLRKKEHKSNFGKNRTHDFRTSRCAAYLLDHSGDELLYEFESHSFDTNYIKRITEVSFLLSLWMFAYCIPYNRCSSDIFLSSRPRPVLDWQPRTRYIVNFVVRG